MQKHLAVVGAGASGLFTCLSLLKLGHRVSLFESHSKAGGCAGYFGRTFQEEKYFFDAGATILNKLSDGEFLNNFLQKIDVPSNFKFLKKESIDFKINEKKFTLKLQSEKIFLESLKNAFPNDHEFINTYFPKIFTVSRDLHLLLEKKLKAPFLTASQLKLFLSSKESFSLVKHSPLLLQNFQKLLKKQACSKEFIEFVNMNLLITLQCKTQECTFLQAAMGLSFYLFDSGTVPGGMRHFFTTLLEKIKSHAQAEVFMKSPITAFSENSLSFHNKTQNFDEIYWCLPRYTVEKLDTQDVLKLSQSKHAWKNLKSSLWSAFCVYGICEDSLELAETAFNLHLKENKHEYYLSFSKRNDLLRCQQGKRIFTCSNHIDHQYWSQKWPDYKKKVDFPNRATYEIEKEKLSQQALQALKNYDSSLKILFHEGGSPLSFQHYTKRTQGSVGGIPSTFYWGIKNPATCKTRLKNQFILGDSSFPGQSVLSAAYQANALFF